MQLNMLDFVFWAAGFFSQLILLVVLLHRRLATQFPLFTGLVAGNVARTVILYIALRCAKGQTYSFVYWSMALIDVCLQIGVVYELAAHIFRPLGDWAPDIQRSSIAILCGSLVVAGALSWLATPNAATWQQLLVVKGSFFSSALMSELFVSMIASTLR